MRGRELIILSFGELTTVRGRESVGLSFGELTTVRGWEPVAFVRVYVVKVILRWLIPQLFLRSYVSPWYLKRLHSFLESIFSIFQG